MNIYASSFGKCLENCLAKIIESPEILRSSQFAETLADAAQEWGEMSESLNGGNDTRYNLCRMGKYIREITRVCRGPDSYSCGNPIDWEEVLNDVRYVNKVVRHELIFNLNHISPNPIENDYTPEYKKIDP